MVMETYEQLSFSFMNGVKPCEHKWKCGSPVLIDGEWYIETKCVKCDKPLIVGFSNSSYMKNDLEEYKQLLKKREQYVKKMG